MNIWPANPPPPTIAGLTLEQWCVYLGFIDRDGHPDVRRLRLELEVVK